MAENGKPGGAPQIMIDGVPLTKPEPTGLRLLKFLCAQVAEQVSKHLPPGVGFALILTDAGHEGFWSVRTGGEANHLRSAAQWLGANGIAFGAPAAAEPAKPVEVPPAPLEALPTE